MDLVEDRDKDRSLLLLGIMINLPITISHRQIPSCSKISRRTKLKILIKLPPLQKILAKQQVSKTPAKATKTP